MKPVSQTIGRLTQACRGLVLAAIGGLSAAQLAADDRGALDERFEGGEGEVARDVFHAAVGGRDQPLRRQVGEGGTDAGGDGLGRLRLGVADDAEDHGLAAEAFEGCKIEVGWAA
jgi:hypothetical protein